MRFKFNSSSVNFMEYKRLNAVVKKSLKRIKKSSFLEYCAGLNRFSNIGHVWSRIRSMLRNYHRDESGNVFSEEAVIAVNKSIDSLCPDWVPVRPVNFDLSDNPTDLDGLSSWEEMVLALANTRDRSAPDTDGIDYKLLKALPHNLLKGLLHILNSIFVAGVYPKEWNHFRVFFIPKSDKKTYFDGTMHI